MKLSIDVYEYWRLPKEVKVAFDEWMEAEGLVDELIKSLTVHEGYIVAERLVVVESGPPVVIEQGRFRVPRLRTVKRDSDGEVVFETVEIPVSKPPPAAAFADTGM